MAVVAPEEAAAMFARNPELAQAHPDVMEKVNAAVAAKQTAVKAAETAHTAVKRSPAGHSLGIGRITLVNPSSSVSKAAGVKTGAGRALVTIFFAFVAFVVALEIASMVSGRYFTWDLKNAGKAAQDGANYVGLYPGQKKVS